VPTRQPSTDAEIVAHARAEATSLARALSGANWIRRTTLDETTVDTDPGAPPLQSITVYTRLDPGDAFDPLKAEEWVRQYAIKKLGTIRFKPKPPRKTPTQRAAPLPRPPAPLKLPGRAAITPSPAARPTPITTALARAPAATPPRPALPRPATTAQRTAQLAQTLTAAIASPTPRNLARAAALMPAALGFTTADGAGPAAAAAAAAAGAAPSLNAPSLAQFAAIMSAIPNPVTQTIGKAISLANIVNNIIGKATAPTAVPAVAMAQTVDVVPPTADEIAQIEANLANLLSVELAQENIEAPTPAQIADQQAHETAVALGQQLGIDVTAESAVGGLFASNQTGQAHLANIIGLYAQQEFAPTPEAAPAPSPGVPGEAEGAAEAGGPGEGPSDGSGDASDGSGGDGPF